MQIKIFIISTSTASARDTLKQLLRGATDLQVLGCASDPAFAADKIKQNKPDVILFDCDVPRGDTISLIKRISSANQIPIVAYALLPENENARTVELMAAGATIVVPRSQSNLPGQRGAKEEALLRKIRMAPHSRPGRPNAPSNPAMNATTSAMQERQASPRLNADAILPAPSAHAAHTQLKTTERIIVIGVSTGGTQALEYLLPRLPRESLGIAIVQHMPENFTAGFANRLNDLSKLEVREAKSGDRIQKGHAFIAPGGKHLLVKRNNLQQYVTEVREGPMVNRHRPSVDVLFRSAAVHAGINATGFILTGMGDDGAVGMKEMRNCGSHTIAQDEASCVVFGMPKEAIRHGGVIEVLSLDAIAHKIAAMR